MVLTLVDAGAEMTPYAQEYLQAMQHFIAAVLSILPSTFPAGLRQDIIDLVLEQHTGEFVEGNPRPSFTARAFLQSHFM